MRIGTILRNAAQPSRESLLVYTGTSGQYAKCLWIIDGTYHGMHDFYKRDIQNNREAFPIVGFFDYRAALVSAVQRAAREAGKNGTIIPAEEEGEG